MRTADTPSMSFTAAKERPVGTLGVLAALVVLSLASTLVGDRAFDRGWGAAPWIRLPGAIAPFVVGGLLIWLVLLAPDGRFTGTWTKRSASACLAATLSGIVIQLLDDHVNGHAGTDNPLGFNLPLQDVFTLVALVVLGLAFLGAVLTLPGRISRSRARRAGR